MPIKQANKKLSSLFDDLLEAYAVQCEFCHHMGHDFPKCPLKKQVDRIAKLKGLANEWGQIKHVAYFGAYLQNNQQLAAKLNAQFQARQSLNVRAVVPVGRRRA